MGNWHLSGAGREICEQGYTAWAMAAGLRHGWPFAGNFAQKVGV